VVGTLASLSPEKGLTYLVKAATLIPYASSRLRFVIVGDGECRGELESQVRQEGLESTFQFVGFQDQVVTYLNAFDLLVLPSLSEGLSSAILAAMAASLPVIATNVGGIPELVQHGFNGLLVPPRDPVALAKAIQFLCDNPREACEMGRRGRQRMEERFTLERKTSETEELCYALLGRPAPSPGAAHA
jgi:glycosyltransferase involved in cell wall biosynthesis